MNRALDDAKLYAREYAKEYYRANKEKCDSRTYANIAKRKAIEAEMKARGVPVTKKVPQAANTLTIKEVAALLELTMPKTRAISKDARYNMPKYTQIRLDGAELYDLFQIKEWMQQYKEVLTQLAITGRKHSNNGITLTREAMLLVNWVVNCAHIERHTMRLQQEAASKRLCASYGVKSLLEIKL